MQRLEFRRRYSRACDYFASRFTHGEVREFFEHTAGARCAIAAWRKILNAKIPGSAWGMAEPGKLDATHGEFGEDAPAISAVMLDEWSGRGAGPPFCDPPQRSGPSESKTGVYAEVFPKLVETSITVWR
jgi:hypothetical protein